MVHVKGVDVFDATTGELRSDGADGIAVKVINHLRRRGDECVPGEVRRLTLMTLFVAEVQSDHDGNRCEDGNGNEEERKHQRSTPNATPASRHGPATTTIATISLRVNVPCVTRNSSGARTTTSTPASLRNSPSMRLICRSTSGVTVAGQAEVVPWRRARPPTGLPNNPAACREGRCDPSQNLPHITVIKME